MNGDEKKEWEKQQIFKRSGNLFEFFFQHNAKKDDKKSENHQAPFEDLFRSFSGANSKKFSDRKSFEKQFKNSKENLELEKERARQAQELKRQQAELLRHQHILKRQQEEEARLAHILLQQEERKRQEKLQRQREEQLRQERARRAEEERQRRLEEERQRQLEEERQRKLEEEKERRREQERKRKRRNSNFFENPLGGNFYERNDRREQRQAPRDKQAQNTRYGNQFENNRDKHAKSHQSNSRSQFREYNNFEKNSFGQRHAKEPDAGFQSKNDRQTNSQQLKLTKGTDGRWYYKDQTGNWKHYKASDHKQESKFESFRSSGQRAESSSNRRQDNSKYIKGNDGKWYTNPDFSESNQYRQSRDHQRRQEADSSRQAHQGNDVFYQRSAQNLPTGLFRNDRGQITDRIGNIYERTSNGQYRVVLTAAQAKERLQQQLRTHKQTDFLQSTREQQQPTPTPSKQQIFHDATGNVYFKDPQGNLIRIKPGSQGGTNQNSNSRSRQASDGYSYRDPNKAEQQKGWYAREHDRSRYRDDYQQQNSRSRDHYDSYSRSGHRERQHRSSQKYRPLHEEL